MEGFLLRLLISALVTLVPSPDASMLAVPKLKTDSLISCAWRNPVSARSISKNKTAPARIFFSKIGLRIN
ncbi:MAG: hypothetical protein BWX45_00927 [Deltaproteobacteria bacterium ADurb.Bin002]|nr:MAG: hypothetical protein BWX45_00927 [Deltaproteobacteria bacterium ADurb.Bin002]